MGSSPPPSDPDLPQSPAKSYSQVSAPAQMRKVQRSPRLLLKREKNGEAKAREE
ncbi:hypothetical protein F2Q69_00009826 [Brassica cretica]|uniref:Uncharacterized protein n=1 Tax=Brassica cretica TaxID=69181 RepID=A0A8S9P0Z2_BRACR|nr:hypothetical protein F2Q69_00009826 [Brassica cretica]